MRLFINRKPVDIFPGMTVKHALINAGLLEKISAGMKVYDAWGNEVGLDGAVYPGLKLYLK